jgi:outer membrane usher protein FimD/PapC
MCLSIERGLLPVATVCALFVLGAAPVRSQVAGGSDWSLVDLHPQVYAVPDVPSNGALSRPLPGSSAGTSLWPMPVRYASRYGGGVWREMNVDGPMYRSRFRLSTSSVTGFWSRAARSWRYAGSSGLDLVLGNELSQAPVWSRPVRLAGVGISRAPLDDAAAMGEWSYAMAVGALDDSGSTVSSGGLDYGPTAYDASAQYDLSTDLSFASQLQGTSDMLTLGVGGEYAMDRWGSWALGISRARRSLGNGWRHHVGYQAEVLDDLRLSWVNERRGAGYADLSSYTADGSGCDCVRNQWRISVPTGPWGKFSGTYERLDGAGEDGSQRIFGLAQRFWYNPQLRVRLEANRNIATGAYGLSANFSLPLD